MGGLTCEDLVGALLVELEAQRAMTAVGGIVTARRRDRNRRRGWWEKRGKETMSQFASVDIASVLTT